MPHPLQATGWVLRKDRGRAKFVGTCFAFRNHCHLLTAAHCVAGVDPSELSVSIFTDRLEPGLEVKRLICHPKADLAVLEIATHARVFTPYDEIATIYDWGTPVSAFGYPEDTGLTGLEPTPRYFRGHVQRFFSYKSPLGYEYEAAELSFGAPGGLSGGPVIPEIERTFALGLVAENIESTTYLSTVSEVREGESIRSEMIHSMINYGIAVRLDVLTSWLNENAPRMASGA